MNQYYKQPTTSNGIQSITTTVAVDTIVAAKEKVRHVYQEIAGEYDERIPGKTPVDERFTSTEIAFVMNRIDASAKVLDMGCGTGRFTIPMAKRARDVTGLDISSAMLGQLRQKAEAENLNIELHEGDMEQLPFEPNTFDVVVCMLALMHIPIASRQQVFLEASRVLKPGGRMIISAKNANFEKLCRVDRFATVDITDVDAGELIFTQTRSQTEYKAPWHSFSPQDFKRLFATAGLQLVDLKGMIPLSVWLSDNVLVDPAVNAVVRSLEALLSHVEPFNQFGYHLLAEAVKPIR